jgi:hypothetical protein
MITDGEPSELYLDASYAMKSKDARIHTIVVSFNTGTALIPLKLNDINTYIQPYLFYSRCTNRKNLMPGTIECDTSSYKI